MSVVDNDRQEWAAAARYDTTATRRISGVPYDLYALPDAREVDDEWGES